MRVQKWGLFCLLVACGPTPGSGLQVEGGEARRAPSASSSAAPLSPVSEAAVPEVTAPGEVEQMVVSGAGACLRWNTGRVRCLGTDDEVENVDDAVDMSSDGETTCVARGDGRVACWGFQASLERGRPPSRVPVPIPGLKDVVDVELQYVGNALRDPTLCAAMRTGEIACSCDRASSCPSGKFGIVTGVPPSKRAVGTREAGCALTRDQRVWCWNTWHGQAGSFVSGLSEVEQLVSWQGANCARLKDERVLCWGANHAGELGRGYQTVVGDPTEQPTDHERPLAVGPKARFMAPGAIIDDGGQLFVWGDNGKGQRLPGEGLVLHEPTSYAAPGSARLVAASSDRSCMLDDDGRVKCWGAPSPLAPAEAREVDEARDAVAIEAAGGHICALRKSGHVTCWGNRSEEQDGEEVFEPRDVGVGDAVEIAVSHGAVCVRSKDRRVRCWGVPRFDDGEPLSGVADAIGFAGDTLCLADAKEMRCSSPLFDNSPVGGLKALPVGAPSAETKLHHAGPGGSRGWAKMLYKQCFIRNVTAFCADGKQLNAIRNVTGVKELGKETILLTNGTVVSPRKPATRVSKVPIRALVGDHNHGVGNDGRLYYWSFGGQGNTVPRQDLAAITDAVDMVGDGFPSSFGCVVHQSGKVSCWGAGARGEIGLGDRRQLREIGRIK